MQRELKAGAMRLIPAEYMGGGGVGRGGVEFEYQQRRGEKRKDE